MVKRSNGLHVMFRFLSCFILKKVLLVTTLFGLTSNLLAGLPVQSQNPFSLILSIPEHHEWENLKNNQRYLFRLQLTQSNHWFISKPKPNRIFIDSESTLAQNRWVYYQDALQFYIEIAYLRHGGGSLDNFLHNYHQWMDLPNANRERYPERLSQIRIYTPQTIMRLTPKSGFLEPVFGVGIDLGEGTKMDYQLFFRLKTGLQKKDNILSQGAWSVSGFLKHSLDLRPVLLRLQYGLLWQQHRPYLLWQTKPWVGFSSLTLSYVLTSRWSASLQYDYHGKAYTGPGVIQTGESHMGSLGFIYKGKRTQWYALIQEDLLLGSTADVSFHLTYERAF